MNFSEIAAGGELPDDFLDLLKSRKWPGNIRELFNVFERLSVMFPDGRLSGRPIAALLEASGLKEAAESYEQEEASPVSIREHIQKNIIVNALESAKGMSRWPPKWLESRGARFTNVSKNSNSPPDNCKKQAYFSWYAGHVMCEA